MNTAGVSRRLLIDRRLRPHNNHHQQQQPLNCPRCDSINTKFCYYNNYNLSQPRHFCKNCRRYWTNGGVLRNVPVGGGCRKSHRSVKPKPKRNLSPPPPLSPSPLPPPHPPSAPSSSESSTTIGGNGGGFRWPEISFGNDNSMLFSGGFVSLMNDDHNNNNNNNNNMCNLSSTASFGEILENRGGYDVAAAAATMENCNWQENPITVTTANEGEGEGLGLFDFGLGVDDHRQSLYWNQQQPTTLTLDDHTNWAPPPIPNCSHHALFFP